MYEPGKAIEKRLQSLEAHLSQENSVLVEVVESFRELDEVAYGMGILDRDQSFATRIPWWPLIAVLGTFSAGKSTFINHYLGTKLQTTGNQAVDDKFTVISFSKERESHVLPGLALDADPRFPFYKISHEIEKVAAGEGRRIDAYLQLKTCPSEKLRGKILIDSPGFDADAQRTSTLRISNHIIDLSDLVLVLFDARHPEPGAMQDTLQHLVAETIRRPDSNKFLYILNQLDTTAREDNPEEVVAAWQRALAQKGLTAGRFYGIYDPHAAVPIEDANLRRRFESKRDHDLAEIHRRIHEVEVERSYRIVGALEKAARDFEERIVPRVQNLMAHWRSRTLLFDGLSAGGFALLLVLLFLGTGSWEAGSYQAGWWNNLTGSPWLWVPLMVLLIAASILVHFHFRRRAAEAVVHRLFSTMNEGLERDGLARAFRRNTRPWRSLFMKRPAGWNKTARSRVHEVLLAANGFVQALNDRYTNPSGVELKVLPRHRVVESEVTDQAEPPDAERPRDRREVHSHSG